MIVKICGLTGASDAATANDARPDWAGVVLHGPSRRCVDAETASAIRRALDPSVPLVGVTVDRDPALLGRMVDDGTIDMVQIHANPDEAYFRAVRGLGVPVVRAYIVRSREDVEAAASSDADYVMVDAGAGSGRAFDWSLMEDAGFGYILSGGLDPGNVAETVRRLRPMGVDVSSGVEVGGRKDPARMRAFVDAARSARYPFDLCRSLIRYSIPFG